MGGKGGLKLSIATCGLHFHVLGLRSHASFCHNDGEHGALGRFCSWRNLRAAGGRGQARRHRKDSPQEGRKATLPPSCWTKCLPRTSAGQRACRHVGAWQGLGQDTAGFLGNGIAIAYACGSVREAVVAKRARKLRKTLVSRRRTQGFPVSGRREGNN